MMAPSEASGSGSGEGAGGRGFSPWDWLWAFPAQLRRKAKKASFRGGPSDFYDAKEAREKEVLRIILDEIGRVVSVGYGIARVYGLDEIQTGEMVEFSNGVKGIAIDQPYSGTSIKDLAYRITFLVKERKFDKSHLTIRPQAFFCLDVALINMLKLSISSSPELVVLL
ncbi:Alpha subunit of the F1 sector of mitochondrial F1F0 ATP synthase [Datura stramonium]|uniref:Alpha subunit of the F1 sector of mitochondrial F1F0 ATP synthase n=1 Tax=Datura stramonium TaxID=4076 RepID=A0ABS8Y6T1_DATST|nr:Alpha subunit of the F1 sector of mitochondrial F1F0 ATP synthase [Datura stramonium]